ncbi:zinc ribbon-containing protein [Microbulbifer variabilis]|uniref:zinc ribbon-containing protein n=1 Tax=Microbulbifer variabilis TaxID=266805 RepID=UPI001CFF08EF|nr:zinc ribbon-containing protein [Microbulbifer variabilis]
MTKEPKLPPKDDLADEFREDLEDLVEGELAVENLTANKVAFLRAWLKDDLHRAGDYMRGLGGELLTLEERGGDWLLNAADPTETAWPNLMRCIREGKPWALAGEIVGADEELQCLGCGYLAQPPKNSQITPCHRCGYGCFRQIEGGLEY